MGEATDVAAIGRRRALRYRAAGNDLVVAQDRAFREDQADG